MLNFQGHGFLVRQMIPKVRNQKVHHQHSSSNQTKPFWIQCIAMQTQPTTRYVTTRSSWAVSHISAVNPQCGSHTPPQNEHFVVETYWSSSYPVAAQDLPLSTLRKDKWEIFELSRKNRIRIWFLLPPGDLLRECRWWLRCRGFLRRHRRLPRGERESPQTKLNQKCTLCPGEALCPSSCGNRLVSNLYDVAFTVFRRSL